MYQRDYILVELQKFARMMARLMGLKEAGKLEEFDLEVESILQTEYDSDLDDILALDEDAFNSFLQNKNFSAEKLNALSQILYVYAQPFDTDDVTPLLLKKILIIFDLLAERHHYTSFENTEKSNAILRYLALT
ncbi:hypothetical protein ACXZ1K_13685 [Pedobacter sp. PWIIR3]